jgi:hypothetical protein
MKVPEKVPEKGFYYHYKHDPKGLLNNYAYEVIGVGYHTEDDCRSEDTNMVIYRPLYEDARVYKAGKLFDLRPLEMWMGEVVVNSKTIKRFRKITDPVILAELAVIKKEMYGNE